MNPISDTDLLEFRSLIARRLGLWFDEHRRDFLADVLRERTAACGCEAPADYIRKVATTLWRDERPVLAGLLTVAETYFLRGSEHFRALVETVLPEVRRPPATPRRLRLLSAGCASGEEAYSLAIFIREHAAATLTEWPVEIVGVDISPDALAKARLGRYSAWSLRETAAEIREKYFRVFRQEFVLEEAVRTMAAFHECNLADPDDAPWPPGAFDVVFCRNTLMYFSPEKAAAVVSRIQRVLTPGGFLFLGHAETLRGVSQAFHLRRSHGAFYYQLRGAEEEPPAGEVEIPARTRAAPQALPAAAVVVPAAVGDVCSPAGSWMNEIGRASARIATLAAGAKPPASRASAGWSRTDGEISRILDLHQQERFADALSGLQGLPADIAPDADLQVLQAVLLVNCGRLSEAEALCRPLLGGDDLNAGAHYVAALCREHAGDFAAAEEHDEAAAYLDPVFAMPRFHLGLLCKRVGRGFEARAHFEKALALFVKEDPVRLLLFGGGFARETLVQACRAEIRRLGGAR